MVYSRGGCVGIEVCEIPVVEFENGFLIKIEPGPVLTHFIDSMLWKNPPGLSERVRKRTRERYGEWEALTQL